MANANVKFDDSEWRKFLGSMLSKSKDMASILGLAYATKGIADIQQHFREEKGPAGAWKPRKQSTDDKYLMIASGLHKAPKGTSRAQYNPGNKILQMTGKLRNSFLRNGWTKRSNTSIEAFSNDTKSGAHNNGNKEKNLPARPFMWLSGEAKEVMAKIILDKLWH